MHPNACFTVCFLVVLNIVFICVIYLTIYCSLHYGGGGGGGLHRHSIVPGTMTGEIFHSILFESQTVIIIILLLLTPRGTNTFVHSRCLFPVGGVNGLAD